MTTDDIRKDPVMRMLAALPAGEPDRRRADRIRARCHAAMGRLGWTGTLAGLFCGSFCRRTLEPALVVGISAVYLAEVVRRVLLLYGF
jgi:hypothetical protein